MKKVYFVLAVLIVVSMFLSACAPPDYGNETTAVEEQVAGLVENESVVITPDGTVNGSISIERLDKTEQRYYTPDFYKVIDSDANVLCYVVRANEALSMQCFKGE